jgi:hypothetical protein
MTALGEAVKIAGDAVVISFRGQFPARFRLQHTRDLDGEPDDLGWCDVSLMSDADITDPHEAVGQDSLVPVLLDRVDGDREVRYRRFKADWLRVLAGDDDEDMCERCAQYTISIRTAA